MLEENPGPYLASDEIEGKSNGRNYVHATFAFLNHWAARPPLSDLRAVWTHSYLILELQ